MAVYIEIQKTDRVGPSRVTINNNFQALETLINEKISGLDWQESVLTFTDELSAIESSGNRYIADSNGTSWVKDNIYEWGLPEGPSSSVSYEWLETVVDSGTACRVEDVNELYLFNGVDWILLTSALVHNDLSGIQGGNATERYHLTSSQHTILTSNGDAQPLHYHDLEVSAPSNHGSTGIKGQWAKDDNYYYYCVDTDIWVRHPVETVFPDPESSSSSSSL